MAELVKWPELERMDDQMGFEGGGYTPVELRFQVKPGSGEDWGDDLVPACLVNGAPAQVPAQAAAFAEWEAGPQRSLYCYAPAAGLKDGAEITLRVHPRGESGKATAEVLWEKSFRVRVAGEDYALEEVG